MSFYDILGMLGGLCLFLFGMSFMGKALERRAGNRLEAFLAKLTTKKLAGFFTGLAVTAVIQSSTATTVMVVGFVNSGLMTLGQAVNVIMGANVGTTATAWLLSLRSVGGSGIAGLFRASTFTPFLALVGIILYMFGKKDRKRDTGEILLGFSTLMYGMEIMSASVSGLSGSAKFGELFLLFENPLLGMIAGALLTAVVQSSSAAIGILQTLAMTGKVTYGAAIPIIMGQNIGTCVTALLSSVGATKNAKRAAVVHLSFNVIGAVVWIAVFSVLRRAVSLPFLDRSANLPGIAVSHTVFNILCTLLLFPLSDALKYVSMRLVPDSKVPEKTSELDERLLNTPAVALERCRSLTVTMASGAVGVFKSGFKSIFKYSDELAYDIRKNEEKTDRYEDILNSYLVKLGGMHLGSDEGPEVTRLMRVIEHFERIADCGVRLLECAERGRDKNIVFSDEVKSELETLRKACGEVNSLALAAFSGRDLHDASEIPPLSSVIEARTEEMRGRQIMRMQSGELSVEGGVLLSDILRTADESTEFCGGIAACAGNFSDSVAALHRRGGEADELYESRTAYYTEKYAI